MTKIILGTYMNEQDAIVAVNKYQLMGYDADDMNILTNNDPSLEKHTDVDVTSVYRKEQDQEDSFSDKVKRIFFHEVKEESSAEEILFDIGLDKEKANNCIRSLKSGEIVVVGDDSLKMGHA